MGIRLPWDTMSPQLLAFALVFGFVVGIAWLVLRQGVQGVLDETLDMTRGVISWATGHAVDLHLSNIGGCLLYTSDAADE